MLPKVKVPRKEIYLDHAAATPLDPEVLKAMMPFFKQGYGNPSSLYKKGAEAKAALEESRKKIAALIGARPEEIIFTAGGTESVNLAIMGVATAVRPGERPSHFITSAIEHHAVLRSFEALEKWGRHVTYAKVSSEGFIDLKILKESVRPETVLISVMYANNEVGSIQPVSEIGKWIKQINTDREKNGLTRILLHTDACQAAGSLDLNVNKLGVDLMSVNGSKIYGPKQTGFLYIRTGVNLSPVIYGGGQERDLRSGTENVAGAAGLAKALELCQKHSKKENGRLTKLRDYFISQVQKRIKNVELNGPRENRLPNNVNFSIQGVEGEALMLYLDSYNVFASTGSACTETSNDPSHVLLAMGKTPEQSLSSVRFTLGKGTDKKQLDYVIKLLPLLVEGLRQTKNE